MKITKSQLKEMIREAIGGILNKDIVKFTAEEMEELQRKGQIEKGDKVYQYQAPFKEGKLTEAKKPVSFKLGGVTFGKDYQGLKSRNGGIRYYYQKGTGAKHMESDFGKFIVKVGGLVSSNDKNKVAKKLKEGKLTEARQSQFKIPYREQKNVMKILRTAKSAKVGKYKEGVHYDFGVGKGPTFILAVDKKLENEILSLLVQKGVRQLHAL